MLNEFLYWGSLDDGLDGEAIRRLEEDTERQRRVQLGGGEERVAPSRAEQIGLARLRRGVTMVLEHKVGAEIDGGE